MAISLTVPPALNFIRYPPLPENPEINDDALTKWYEDHTSWYRDFTRLLQTDRDETLAKIAAATPPDVTALTANVATNTTNISALRTDVDELEQDVSEINATVATKITQANLDSQFSGKALGKQQVDYNNLVNVPPTPAGNNTCVVIFTQTASGATLTNTVTGAILDGTGVGTTTVAANTLKVGSTIRYRASGIYSSDNTGSTSLTFQLCQDNGSNVLCSAAFTCPSSKTDEFWNVDAIATVRTSGASGTIFTQGLGTFSQGVATANGMRMRNTATTVIDTTASHILTLVGVWSFASSSNKVTCTNMVIEVLNP